MPLRKDEWVRRTEKDLRYCVLCEQYLTPAAWTTHEHNPEYRQARGEGSVEFLTHLLSDVVYLGGVRVFDCASVLVVDGMEVFRLRERTSENRITVDLDVRGPGNTRLAVVKNGEPILLAPGHSFEDIGSACAVVDDATGCSVVSVESISSKAIRLLGVFWVKDFPVRLNADGLELGAATVPAGEFRGTGTAILLKKNRGEVGFARR